MLGHWRAVVAYDCQRRGVVVRRSSFVVRRLDVRFGDFPYSRHRLSRVLRLRWQQQSVPNGIAVGDGGEVEALQHTFAGGQIIRETLQ